MCTCKRGEEGRNLNDIGGGSSCFFITSVLWQFYICMQYILLTLPTPSLRSIPCLSLFSLTVPFLDRQLVGWFSNTLSPIRASIGPLIGTIHWSLAGTTVSNPIPWPLLTLYIHILKECQKHIIKLIICSGYYKFQETFTFFLHLNVKLINCTDKLLMCISTCMPFSRVTESSSFQPTT